MEQTTKSISYEVNYFMTWLMEILFNRRHFFSFTFDVMTHRHTHTHMCTWSTQIKLKLGLQYIHIDRVLYFYY